MRGLEFGSFEENMLCLLDRKVTHGVEDPVERETKFSLSMQAGALKKTTPKTPARGRRAKIVATTASGRRQIPSDRRRR